MAVAVSSAKMGADLYPELEPGVHLPRHRVIIVAASLWARLPFPHFHTLIFIYILCMRIQGGQVKLTTFKQCHPPMRRHNSEH
jgi:hypothetical protein